MSVHMYKQKLYKNGNSVAVTIPKQYLKESNLRDGTEVHVTRDQDTGAIIVVSKRDSKPKQTITPRFLEIVEKVNKQYAHALKELAEK